MRAQCLCGKKAIECFGRRGGGSFNRLADESQEPVKERKIIFLEEVIRLDSGTVSLFALTSDLAIRNKNKRTLIVRRAGLSRSDV